MIPFAALMRRRLLLLPLVAALARADDLEEMRDRVAKIGKPGIPGPIALLDDSAFAIAGARMGDGTIHPVVAAATAGRGRLVAFGHGGYFHDATLAVGQTGRLVEQTVAWAARGKKRVGVVVGLGELDAFLKKRGYRTRAVKIADLPGLLAEIDVLCLSTPTLGGRKNVDALRAWVRRGNGLVVAGLVWGWKQLNPKRSVETDHELNALLTPMGLCFADGYTKQILALDTDLSGCHAGRALALLKKKRRLGKKKGAQLASVVMAAYGVLPASERRFRERVRRLARGDDVVPTKEKPVTEADVVARLALLVRHKEVAGLAPDKVRAAASADDFPGTVARAAPRVTRRVAIDPALPGWASTGLYAPPGEVVRIEFPERTAPARYRARIGCHTDVLWGKAKWTRHPEISRSFPLAAKTRIASPHGGLVYVEVPGGAEGAPFQVTISGAVEAPLFVLGGTDPEAWRKTIRDRPGPWAEFANSKIVFTLPSTDARAIDDPTKVLEFWERVLDLYAELGQRPLAKRRQRMVPDRQISAGWLHAGYPIMMQLQHGADAVDLDLLTSDDRTKTPGWGFWHELGHNHQRGEWTFAGTGEVTCNLFSLYVGDRMRGIAPASNPWPDNAKAKAVLYLRGDRDFGKWKKSPGIALWTYILVIEEFGWDAIRKTFLEYAGLPRGELPRSDDEKRDQWLVRLSRNVGRNLGPYFEAWGIPTSKEARDAVADLETWLPAMVEEARR